MIAPVQRLVEATPPQKRTPMSIRKARFLVAAAALAVVPFTALVDVAPVKVVKIDASMGPCVRTNDGHAGTSRCTLSYPTEQRVQIYCSNGSIVYGPWRQISNTTSWATCGPYLYANNVVTQWKNY